MKLLCVAAVAAVTRAAIAAPAPCLPAATSAPSRVIVNADTATLCFTDDDKTQCFAQSLADGKLAAAQAPPAIAPVTKVTSKDGVPTVCKADGTSCKALRPQNIDTGIEVQVSVNTTGTLAAYSIGRHAETWDLTTGKRIAAFPVGRADDPCADLDWVGDTLMVSEYNCAGPDNTSFLATRTGHRIGGVGPSGFATAGTTPVQVDGTRWAFDDAGGSTVVIEDIATGKITKTIATGMKDTGVAQLTMAGNASKLVIAYGVDRGGTLVVIDVATGKARTVTGPVCPQ